MLLIPFITYFIYMVRNCWTDIRSLKTHNTWHVLFLAVGLAGTARKGLLVEGLVVFLFTLFFFLFFEIYGSRLKAGITWSAGDTKMMAVTSLYVFLTTTISILAIPSVLLVTYFFLSFMFNGSFALMLLFYTYIVQGSLSRTAEWSAGSFHYKYETGKGLPSFYWQYPASPMIFTAALLIILM